MPERESDPPVQRSTIGASRGFDADGVHPGVLRPSSGGAPLPTSVRATMERALGHDFADVRVHHGGEAESIGAVAYARGTHLHFAPGRYQPHSAEGQRLLGHELAHVVQQRARRVAHPGGAVPINADPALEREADAAAAQVSQARAVATPVTQGGSPAAHAQAGAAIQPMMEEEDADGAAVASPPARVAAAVPGRNRRPPPPPASTRDATAWGAARQGRGGPLAVPQPGAAMLPAGANEDAGPAGDVAGPAARSAAMAAASPAPVMSWAERVKTIPRQGRGGGPAVPHPVSAIPPPAVVRAPAASASVNEDAGPAREVAEPAAPSAEMASASPEPVMSGAERVAAARPASIRVAKAVPARPAASAAAPEERASASKAELTPRGAALLKAVPKGSGLKGDKYHAEARRVLPQAARDGKHFRLDRGATLTQMRGTLRRIVGGKAKDVEGRYEYIVENDNLTHAFFVEGGNINGKPNKR